MIMKKILCTIFLIGVCFFGYSQGGWVIGPTNYGTKANKRVSYDSTFLFPAQCGAPTSTVDLHAFNLHKPALLADTCGHSLYWFDPSDSSWSVLGGSTDSSTFATLYRLYKAVDSVSDLALLKANNLSDLTSTETAKSNLNIKQTTTAGTTSAATFVGEIIESISVIEPTEITISIGTTLAGTDIVDSWTIIDGVSNIEINRTFLSGGTLYFTGLTGNSIIKIYKR